MPPSLLIALLLMPLGPEGSPSAWDRAGAWVAATIAGEPSPAALRRTLRRPAMRRGPPAPIQGGRRY